jgi:MFS transporter, FHS family, Na+ dependent glucose transporter 1
MSRTPATPVFLSSFVGLGLVALMLGPSVNQFAVRSEVSKDTAGILFTVGAVGYLVGSLLCGRLLAQHEARQVGIVGLGVIVSSLLLCAVAPSLWLIGVGQVLLGLGAALVDVTGNSVILWVHQGGSMMAALHLCFSIGAIFSPLLIARSLDWTGEVRVAYLVAAAVLAALMLAVAASDSPVNPHASESGVSGKLTGKQPALLALGILFYMFYVGVEVGFGGWIVDYGVERGLARTGAATGLATVFFFAFAVGRAIGVPFARRATPLVMLATDVGLCTVGLLVMLTTNAPVAMWMGTALFGVGTASMFPAMLSLAEPVLPSTGTVTSLFLAGSSIGSMTLPWLIGRLLTSRGADSMPIVVLIGTLICGLIVLTFRWVAQGIDRQGSEHLS